VADAGKAAAEEDAICVVSNRVAFA